MSTEVRERGGAAGSGTRDGHLRECGRALPGGRGPVVAVACGAALALVLSAGSALVDPTPGEPLVARWLRSLAEHPSRSGTALALALWAILPSRTMAPSARASDGSSADRPVDADRSKSL